MKTLPTFAITVLTAVSLPGQTSPVSGGLSPRFAWEAQTPWGLARSPEIAEALKLMATPVNMAAVTVEPFKIFDNLYYVGIKPVSSFLISTSDGLVLLDSTLPTTADLVLANIRKLGFNPQDLKYILISHSHPDHFGGAGRIKEITGAHIVMSPEDWASVEQQQEAARVGGRDIGIAFKRDVVKGEGDILKIGDNTFHFYVTPGHTSGALSVAFQVIDRGKGSRALSPGGLGMQFGPEWTDPFIRSMDHLKALGPWDVIVTDHPFMMLQSLDETRQELASRSNGPHPVVSGPAVIDDWFGAILKVARAKRTSEQANAKPK